jgi:hypothetical protein
MDRGRHNRVQLTYVAVNNLIITTRRITLVRKIIVLYRDGKPINARRLKMQSI